MAVSILSFTFMYVCNCVFLSCWTGFVLVFVLLCRIMSFYMLGFNLFVYAFCHFFLIYAFWRMLYLACVRVLLPLNLSIYFALSNYNKSTDLEITMYTTIYINSILFPDSLLVFHKICHRRKTNQQRHHLSEKKRDYLEN